MDQDLDLDWEFHSDYIAENIHLYLLPDSDMEDENPGFDFHTITSTSSDREKSKIQRFQYSNLMMTTESLSMAQHNLDNEEDFPNPPPSWTQYLRQMEVFLQEKFNNELEDVLNSIGFHNTYDAFAPHL